jgi:paraquat-inducible protein B
VIKNANPTVIGGFVVGAIALLVAAIVIFGSGKLFVHRPRAVAFFAGDIQGLNAGAPVYVRGVQVGTVTDIELRLDVKTMKPAIAVYLAFDPEHFQFNGALSAEQASSQEPLKVAIANGLHARLVSQSLVTGQLAVTLNLDPDEPRRFVGGDPRTIEIPTAESDLEKLKNMLTELPLDELANSAIKLLKDADTLLTSQDTRGLLRSLAEAGDKLDGLIAVAQDGLPKIFTNLEGTSDSGRAALKSAQDAMIELKTTLTATNQLLTTDGRDALRSAVNALEKANRTLADANTLIAPSSASRYDIDQALRNLAAATRSLRVFAEDLERRPNSILIGK